MHSDVRQSAPGTFSSPGVRNPPHVVLLVADAEMGERLRPLVSAHAALRGSVVLIEVAEGSASSAVQRARAARGGCPMGFLAESEAQSLEAIAAGADEALRLPVIDLPNVLSFVDRVVALASRRRLREREQQSVAQAEKLAALGAIVASVAHEINNPLTAVLLSLAAIADDLRPLCGAAEEIRQLAARGRGARPHELQAIAAMLSHKHDRPDAATLVQEAKVSADSIVEIVRDLLVFARGTPDEAPRLVHVPELIDQVLRIVGHQLKGQALVERDDAPDLPPILVPRTRLALVLTNILVNASQALREIESVCHRVRITTRADGEALAISISDTGPGIPPDVIPHVFDPFFTTKREAVGTGIGLSISRATLRKLGGDLIVESVHGKGATFVVIVPLPDRKAVVQALRDSRDTLVPRSAPSRATVMLVDDDERVLRAYSRALHGYYDLLIAADGQEAIDLLLSGSRPDVIVTDVNMPGVDGVKLHRWLEQERPELAQTVVFVSATTPTFLGPVAQTHCLAKPVSRETLIEAIEAKLSAAPSSASD